MERTDIVKLIEKENEERRYQMEREATDLIREIGDLQAQKAALDARIEEARKALTTLNAELVEAAAVLGND